MKRKSIINRFEKKLELWWFYLNPETKVVIEFSGCIAFFIFFITLCLWVGYEAGKAGLGI